MKPDDITDEELQAVRALLPMQSEKAGIPEQEVARLIRRMCSAQNALRDQRRDKWLREHIAQEIRGLADAHEAKGQTRESIEMREIYRREATQWRTLAAAVREGRETNV